MRYERLSLLVPLVGVACVTLILAMDRDGGAGGDSTPHFLQKRQFFCFNIRFIRRKNKK